MKKERQRLLEEKQPLRNRPSLFMKFAALDAAPDSLLSFANDHGPLITGPESTLFTQFLGSGMLDPGLDTLDSLDCWRSHRMLMEAVIALWQAYRHQDRESLMAAIGGATTCDWMTPVLRGLSPRL